MTTTTKTCNGHKHIKHSINEVDKYVMSVILRKSMLMSYNDANKAY